MICASSLDGSQAGPSRLKVSIVTPSLNQGRYIGQAIESVLEQDYHDVEHIVIDGGSTDDTEEVLGRYAGRIRCVSEPDGGQAEAIVKGIAMSEGAIVGWLSSDDYYLPGAISRIVDAFEQYRHAGVVHGRAMYVDENGRFEGWYPTHGWRHWLAPFTNVIAQPSAFVSRRAYNAVGGIDPGLSYAMDYDLWLRMAAEYELVYIPSALSAYRIHAESKTMGRTHGVRRSREALDVAKNHFGWAPCTRVHEWCRQRFEQSHPGPAPRTGVRRRLGIGRCFVRAYAGYNKRPRLRDALVVALVWRKTLSLGRAGMLRLRRVMLYKNT